MRAHAYPAENTDTLPKPKDIIASYLYLMSEDGQGHHGEIINAQDRVLEKKMCQPA